MSVSSKSKNPDTAIRPRTRPRPSSKTEAELLKQKSEVTKAAVFQTVRNLKDQFLKTLSLGGWVQKYPMKSTGVAILAGFFVGGKIMVQGQRPESLTSPSETSPSARISLKPELSATWASISSLLISSANDILKDLVHTWFVYQLKKQEGEPLAESSP